MTNFEKWKDSLKPKDLILPRIFDNTKCVGFQCKINCPAAATCPAHKTFPKNIQRWKHFAERCDKWFLRWANAPAKEEEE